MKDIALEHDLRYRFGTPRDQGPRPTCLSFAVSDTHAAVREVVWLPLSCEYLHYHAVQRDGAGPGDGATLSAVIATLEQDGQPAEAGWPYLPNSPADLALWFPPTNVGNVFRREGEIVGSSFDDAWRLVVAGRPVVLGMTISDAFYLPRMGVVDAIESVDTIRRHAVVAVAAGHRESSRFLLVRNSWGLYWGITGHAWLADSYLVPRVIQVLALKEAA